MTYGPKQGTQAGRTSIVMSTGVHVVDREGILVPLSASHPTGTDPRSRGVYDEIALLRRTDDPNGVVGALRPGEFHVANWEKVVEVCEKELQQYSKDLQVAVWLADALSHIAGLHGMAEGLLIIHLLLQRFWPDLHPAINEYGIEMQAGRLDELDRIFARNLMLVPIATRVDDEDCALWHWTRVRDLIQQSDSIGPDQADEKRRIGEEARKLRERLDHAVRDTPPTYYEQLARSIAACEAQRRALAETVAQLFEKHPYSEELEDGAPRFIWFREALEGCRTIIEDIMRAKGLTTADSSSSGLCDADTAKAVDVQVDIPNGAISSRTEALRRLSSVAAFFRANEPHSPVAYLVDRAVRWGSMDLDEWLAEVVRDHSVLGNIRETLGISLSNSV